MATPVSNSVNLTGFFNIDRLIQGSAWQLPGNNVLTYSLHTLVDNSIWTTTEIQAIDKAFAAWEAVANIDFVRLGSPNTYDFLNSPADIAIGFTGLDLSSLIEVGTLGLGIFPDPQYVNNTFYNNAINITGTSYTRNNYPQPEGDIFIDDFSNLWFPYLNEGGQGFNTIIHEIGHTLGLKHPGVNHEGNSWDQLHSVMSYNGISKVLGISEIPSMGHAATPMPFDILVVQLIYGPNMSYHTGDNTYILKDDGILKTIWDAGGRDTIDASTVSNNLGVVWIDLREGQFSVTGAYSWTGIAVNTIIENANGSQLDDVINGNFAWNVLNGLGGNDEIYGWEGNDVINGNNGDDTLRGGQGSDILRGGKDNDLLKGGDGHDQLFGGGENDVLLAGKKGDFLKGGSGDDDLRGHKGADQLFGGSGDDTLNGGPGADTLEGGEGADLFIIDTMDIILDFNAAEGDVISGLTTTGLSAVVLQAPVTNEATVFQTGTVTDIKIGMVLGGLDTSDIILF